MTEMGGPWWERRSAPVLVVLLGLLVHLQVLAFGYFADDWGQTLVLEQPMPGARMQPWSLYDFGTRADVARSLGEDVLPWWTDPHWKARFFRPLSSLVLWGEVELFGRNAPLRHALGLVWHGLFLALAWRLYRGLGLTRGVALFALGVLAAEDGAGMSVGWFANRNSLVEGVAVAATGLALLQARRRDRRRDYLLALVCGALAFGAKESGLAAWVLCAAAWWGTGTARARRFAGAAAGCALAALAFLLLSGYGTVSLFYPTPWGDPLRYARHLVGLLASAPLAVIAPVPIDAIGLVPAAFPVLVVLGLGALFCVRHALARLPARFPAAPLCAFYALVSLGLQACALPSDRLLYVPALALAPCAALLWVELGQGEPRARRRWNALFFACGVLSVLATLGREAGLVGLSRGLARVFEQAELERAPVAERDVLMLSSPSVLAALAPRAGWSFTTGDTRTRFHAVQFVRRGLRLRRVAPDTLELESLDEPFLTTPFEGVFLGPSGPPGPQARSTGAYTFELLDERRIRVRVAGDLEAAQYVLLAWDGERWSRVVAPAVGATLELAAPEPLSPLVP